MDIKELTGHLQILFGGVGETIAEMVNGIEEVTKDLPGQILTADLDFLRELRTAIGDEAALRRMAGKRPDEKRWWLAVLEANIALEILTAMVIKAVADQGGLDTSRLWIENLDQMAKNYEFRRSRAWRAAGYPLLAEIESPTMSQTLN